MKLVEREQELSVLRGLHEDRADKRGFVVLLSGPPAVGKTALLNVFADMIRGEAVVLQATASLAERNHPMGVVDQLMAAARLPARQAEHVGRLLRSVDPAALAPSGEASAAGEETAPVPYALGKVLLDLAQDRPVVIAIDDVHHSDALSLETLLYVARRLRLARVFVILTESGCLQYEHPAHYAEILRQAHHHHLHLRPFSQRGVAEALTEALGTREARRLAPMCHALTGGNPLLVRALLEDHQARGVNRPTDMTPGEDFAKAMSACLYRCDPSTLMIAKAIAVLHDHAAPAVLGEVLDLKREPTVLGVDALTRAGLVKAGRFRHDAIRRAVLRSLDDAEHRALRAGAARVLHARAVAAPVVARHLIAGDIEDPGSVPLLREAAKEALAADDVDLAVGCLQLAYRACTDPAVRAALKADLVRAEWRTDPAAALRHVSELLAAAGQGHLDKRDWTPMIACLIWFGRVEQAEDVLAAMRRRAAEAAEPDARVIGDLDLLRLWVASSYPEVFERVSAEKNTSPPVPAEGRITPLRTATLLSTTLKQGSGVESVAGAERILQGSRLDDATLVSMSTAIWSLIQANELDEATVWCERLMEESESRRAPMWRAQFASLRATIDIRRGNMAAAERSASLALTLAGPPSWGVAIGLPLANILLATTAMGSYECAARYLRVPVPEALITSRGGLHYLRARGRYYLATDRPYAALDDFNTCGRLLGRWGLDVASTLTWRTDAAWAHLAIGQPEAARPVIAAELDRLRDDHAWQRGSALRVLAAASAPERRLSLLEEAVELLETAGDQLELAYAIGDLGRVRGARGEENEARALLARSQRLARECGVNQPPNPIGARSGAAVPPPTGATEVGYIGKLSDAELRVASLASQGHTNREIATKLFITVSTVEQHLTQVYRKLKVNRRNDLPLELNPGASLLRVGGDGNRGDK